MSKLVTKKTYKPATVDYTKNRKGMTIPDQSMSITEIVRRFVRGIPVDVIQRQGTYVDQNDYDLEQISRMNFADKASMAQELSAQTQNIADQHKANERSKKEREQQAVEEKKRKASEKRKPGIDPLDNTMPDDTDLTKN